MVSTNHWKTFNLQRQLLGAQLYDSATTQQVSEGCQYEDYQQLDQSHNKPSVGSQQEHGVDLVFCKYKQAFD